MLEMIYTIPEEIGWVLVGFVACLCSMMAVKLGKLFIQMWQNCRNTEEELA